jgi:hypothetical protein
MPMNNFSKDQGKNQIFCCLYTDDFYKIQKIGERQARIGKRFNQGMLWKKN